VALLLTDQGRQQSARSFYRDIYNENDYFHFYASRALAWNDDLIPDTPEDSQAQLAECRKQTLFIKRVQSKDACLLARRIDWVSGTVYDEHDDGYTIALPALSGATTLSASNFYVMTSDFKVYKCIENNGGEASTVKPTSTGDGMEITGDGYTWKYMFQVSASDQSKFLTPEYLPVRKTSGSGQPAFDINGEIDTISVTAGGSSYTSIPTVTVEGDGTGATATAVIASGAVQSITLNTPGNGYSFAHVKFTGGGGSNAAANVTLGSTDIADPDPTVEASALRGTIDKIKVLTVGSNYDTSDAVVLITGDGAGASATPTINARGEITGITVVDAGLGYTFADITITQTLSGGTLATFRAVISPRYGHGANPQKELFAKNVGVTVSFVNDNQDIILGDVYASNPPAGNDFRQIGIIKNIHEFPAAAEVFSSNLFTQAIGTPCYVVAVSNPDEYQLDDIITSNLGGKFIVIQKYDLNSNGTYDVIYLQRFYGSIAASSILTNQRSGTIVASTVPADAPAIVSVTAPEIDVYSGDIIYMDNRRPIIRDVDQIETIKVVFKF